MAATVYNRAKRLYTADDLVSADLRVLLLKSGYTVDPDHNFVSQLTPASNEYSGTNYVRKTLAGKAATQNDTNNRAELDANDVVWTALGPASGGAAVVAYVLFVQVTNDADSVLVQHGTISGTPNGTDVTLAWPAAGITHWT